MGLQGVKSASQSDAYHVQLRSGRRQHTQRERKVSKAAQEKLEAPLVTNAPLSKTRSCARITATVAGASALAGGLFVAAMQLAPAIVAAWQQYNPMAPEPSGWLW